MMAKFPLMGSVRHAKLVVLSACMCRQTVLSALMDIISIMQLVKVKGIRTYAMRTAQLLFTIIRSVCNV